MIARANSSIALLKAKKVGPSKAALKVAGLSRLSGTAGKRATIVGLADGSIGIVIGTAAVMAKDVRYARLGLVIIDEEQRFGAADKAKLRRRPRGAPTIDERDAYTTNPAPCDDRPSANLRYRHRTGAAIYAKALNGLERWAGARGAVRVGRWKMPIATLNDIC